MNGITRKPKGNIKNFAESLLEYLFSCSCDFVLNCSSFETSEGYIINKTYAEFFNELLENEKNGK